MKVSIQRAELLKALQRIQGVVEKRNTLPILGHVLMEAEGREITLFATDLEIGIRIAHPAVVVERGSVTLAGRKFYEIIREIPEEEVRLEASENHAVLIRSGASRFKVMGLAAQDYPVQPPLPPEPLLAIPHGVLLEMVQKTLFAVGENDARYVLNGVLLELKPLGHRRHHMRMVGTDGHRLALAEQEFESPDISSAAGKRSGEAEIVSVIIPRKALTEIKRLLVEEAQDPEVAFANNQLLLRQGSVLLFSRLMEGSFPNYQPVDPQGQRKARGGGQEVPGKRAETGLAPVPGKDPCRDASDRGRKALPVLQQPRSGRGPGGPCDLLPGRRTERRIQRPVPLGYPVGHERREGAF
jgi:DNA polymerase-3 subunit beta